MILHLLYIFAFTAIAFLAIGNLIRSLLTLGLESSRSYAPLGYAPNGPSAQLATARAQRSVPHPEFLDDAGNMINEPLLVMRSMTVEDAREQLDSLYRSSPGGSIQDSTEDA